MGLACVAHGLCALSLTESTPAARRHAIEQSVRGAHARGQPITRERKRTHSPLEETTPSLMTETRISQGMQGTLELRRREHTDGHDLVAEECRK